MSIGFIFWLCVFALFAVLAFIYAAYIIFHRDKREYDSSDLKFTEEELAERKNAGLSLDEMENLSFQHQLNAFQKRDVEQKSVDQSVNNENNDQKEVQKPVSDQHVFHSKKKKED